MEIVKVVGREILDSRGNPTVEVDAHLVVRLYPLAPLPARTRLSSYVMAIKIVTVVKVFFVPWIM